MIRDTDDIHTSVVSLFRLNGMGARWRMTNLAACFFLSLWGLRFVDATSLETIQAENYEINVCVKKAVSSIRLKPSGAYDVLDAKGQVALRLTGEEYVRIDPARNWQPERPFTVSVFAASQYDKSPVRRVAREAREKLGAQHEVRVGRLEPGEFKDDPSIRDTPYGALAVCVGNFDTLEQASEILADVRAHYPQARITRAKSGSLPRARFRISAVDGSTLAALRGPLTLVPAPENSNAHEIAVGTISSRYKNWLTGSEADVLCPDRMIVEGDIKYRLYAINRTHVDKYLRGVVPAEMGAAPLEALKAQAVASRSEALAKVDSGHYLNPMFDLCSTQRTQVYRGMDAANQLSDQAILETAGLVMLHENEVVDAVYSANCGGVTASAEDVWNGEPVPYLRARIDARTNSKVNLATYDRTSKWVNSYPNVFSNPIRSTVIPKSQQKYFRWRKPITQKELTLGINRWRGVGDVKDVRVLERSQSGRVKSIQIIGAKATIEIQGYTWIRRMLPGASSTFFVLTRQFEKNGLLASITLHGAGYGHGVGMCQTGARQMADQNLNYEFILTHYYTGIKFAQM